LPRAKEGMKRVSNSFSSIFELQERILLPFWAYALMQNHHILHFSFESGEGGRKPFSTKFCSHCQGIKKVEDPVHRDSSFAETIRRMKEKWIEEMERRSRVSVA